VPAGAALSSCAGDRRFKEALDKPFWTVLHVRLAARLWQVLGQAGARLAPPVAPTSSVCWCFLKTDLALARRGPVQISPSRCSGMQATPMQQVFFTVARC